MKMYEVAPLIPGEGSVLAKCLINAIYNNKTDLMMKSILDNGISIQRQKLIFMSIKWGRLNWCLLDWWLKPIHIHISHLYVLTFDLHIINIKLYYFQLWRNLWLFTSFCEHYNTVKPLTTMHQGVGSQSTGSVMSSGQKNEHHRVEYDLTCTFVQRSHNDVIIIYT